MTKKHFKEIAKLIAYNTISDGSIDKELFIEDLCKYFQKENEMFDAVKFGQACYKY